jgi:hypothetical protein
MVDAKLSDRADAAFMGFTLTTGGSFSVHDLDLRFFPIVQSLTEF